MSTLSQTCPRRQQRPRDRERRCGSHPSRCRGQQNSPLNGLLFQTIADPIGLSGRAPRHYPMLKNSEIEPPRKSCFRARCVMSADSPYGRAYGSVARGKTGRSADPLRIFSSRPPAVPGIVIDAEIRVFQHNPWIVFSNGKMSQRQIPQRFQW